MVNNQERYKICLQCLRERLCCMHNFLIEKEIQRAIRVIEMRIKYIDDGCTDMLWRNMYGDSYGLCSDCPYTLEHVVISQRRIS